MVSLFIWHELHLPVNFGPHVCKEPALQASANGGAVRSFVVYRFCRASGLGCVSAHLLLQAMLPPQRATPQKVICFGYLRGDV